MSVQYQTTICTRGSCDLLVNFTGVGDDDTTDAASLGLQVYVYDREQQKEVVSIDLDLDEIRALHQHLSSVSLVRDPTTAESGQFVEARDDAAEIVRQLGTIEGLDGSVLKVVLPKIGANRRLQAIINALSADDLELTPCGRAGLWNTVRIPTGGFDGKEALLGGADHPQAPRG